MIYNSAFAIGDRVVYQYCDGFEEDGGVIVAVRFTKSKVFYDILSDYSAKIDNNVDSALVKWASKEDAPPVIRV